MYNFFIEDCLRNTSVRMHDGLKFSNLCCKNRTSERQFQINPVLFFVKHVIRFSIG
jgi:hypothetical protein